MAPGYGFDGAQRPNGYQMNPQLMQYLMMQQMMQQQRAQQAQAQQQQGGGAGQAVQGIVAKKVQEQLYPHLKDALFGGPKVDPKLGQLSEILKVGGVPGTSGIGPVADGAAYADALGKPAGTFDMGGDVGDLFANNPYLQGGAGALGLYTGGKGMYNAYESGSPVAGAISGLGAGAGGLALAAALGASTGGLAIPVMAGMAALGAGGGMLGGKKSTKQIQAERFSDLMNQAQSPDTKSDLQMLSQAATPERTDEAGMAYAAENAEANARNAGARDLSQANATQLWGSNGVLQTFGPDRWLKEFDEKQRYDITDALLKNNLFRHDKGNIIINSREQDRARQIADSVLQGGGQQPQQGQAMAPGYQMDGFQNRGGGNGAFVPNPSGQMAQTPFPENIDPGFNGNIDTTGWDERSPGVFYPPAQQGQQYQPWQPQYQPWQPQQPQGQAIGQGVADALGQVGMTRPLYQPAPPPMPARSNTRSPGIGLDGRRIQY